MTSLNDEGSFFAETTTEWERHWQQHPPDDNEEMSEPESESFSSAMETTISNLVTHVIGPTLLIMLGITIGRVRRFLAEILEVGIEGKSCQKCAKGLVKEAQYCTRCGSSQAIPR